MLNASCTDLNYLALAYHRKLLPRAIGPVARYALIVVIYDFIVSHHGVPTTNGTVVPARALVSMNSC